MQTENGRIFAFSAVSPAFFSRASTLAHHHRLAYVLLLFAALLSPRGLAASPDPGSHWLTSESSHFLLNHPAKLNREARRFLDIAEQELPYIAGFLHWQPRDKVQLNLVDYIDSSQGIAQVFPYCIVNITRFPPIDGELLSQDEWLRIVFIHEIVHIVHLDKSSGVPARLQKIFGRHPLLFPNQLQPAWLKEGLATYIESKHLSGHTRGGRNAGPYYEMLMRLEVQSGLKSLAQINSGMPFWPFNHAYLYGSYFFLFLEQVYGEAAISQFIETYSDNLVPLRIYSNPRASTGKNLNALWDEYLTWLQERYRDQISELQALQHSEAVPSASNLSDNGYFSYNLSRNTRGDLFYVQNDAASHPRIMQIDNDGGLHKLALVHPATHLDAHDQAPLLLTQLNRCDDYRFYYDIYTLDPHGGQLKRRTYCERYQLASWHPSGRQMAAIRVHEGETRLELLDQKAHWIKTLYSDPEQQQISSLDWSPDGNRLLLSQYRQGQWDLFSFSIADQHWQRLSNNPAIESHARYSDDGRRIIYTTTRPYGTVIEMLDIASGKVQQLSFDDGGALQAAGLDSQGVFTYTGLNTRGLDIMRASIPEADTAAIRISANPGPLQPTSRQTGGDNSNTSQTDTLQADKEQLNKQTEAIEYPYAAWRSLPPTYWQPALYISDGDTLALGASFSGQDALALHQYQALTLYEPELEEWFGIVAYAYNQRLFLSAAKDLDILQTNEANDEVLLYSAESDYQLMYRLPHQSYLRTWQAALAYSHKQTDLIIPGHGSQDEIDESLVGLVLSLDSRKSYPLLYGIREGRSVDLTLESYEPVNNQYEGEVLTLDWQEYIPVRQSTLAMRLVIGWSNDQPEPFNLGDTFSEFYTGIPRINQREFSLRGYENNQPALRGRRMQLGSLEWRIPLLRLNRSLMVPPVGLGSLAGNLFVESGATWDRGNSPDDYYSSFGVELMAQSIIAYNLILDTRVGLVHAVDDDLGDDRVYVRVGRAF